VFNVLNQDVSKLGKSGDLVEVAPMLCNFLIPQKLAVNATASILKQVERRREQSSSIIEQKQQAQALKTTLENVGRFTIAKQVGEGEPFWYRHRSRVTALIQEAIAGSRSTRNYTRY